MARTTNKQRAQVNKQLWERANSSHRQRWQTLSQKGLISILMNSCQEKKWMT